MNRPPVDRFECATRCRCQDPEGHKWIYLNAFCAYAGSHRPHIGYGYPRARFLLDAAEYRRAWLAGELDDGLPEYARPGYRKGDVTDDN